MIESVVILNYKSAREVKLTCRKINVFIGPPNTGKSNILEAIGLFTLFNNECKIQELARFQTMHNLFTDNVIDNPVHVITNTHRLKIQFKENFQVAVETRMGTTMKSYELFYDQSGKLLNAHPHYTSPVNLYKFRPDSVFSNKSGGQLHPPYGDNLVLMLLKNSALRHKAGEVYAPFGHKFVVDPMDSSIKIQKESDGVVISYPYTMSSPILQRFLFHVAAIATNKDSIIIFEDPESYASTTYTGQIVQRLAEDETNQYFISSHNPAFLHSLLKAMPNGEVKIYYTTYENDQTMVKPLIQEDYDAILSGNFHVMQQLEENLALRVVNE